MGNKTDFDENDDKVRGMMRGLGGIEPPEGFVQAVIDEGRTRRTKRRPIDLRIAVPAFAGVALLLVFLAFPFIRENDSDDLNVSISHGEMPQAPKLLDAGPPSIPDSSDEIHSTAPQSEKDSPRKEVPLANGVEEQPEGPETRRGPYFYSPEKNRQRDSEENEVGRLATKPAPQVNLGNQGRVPASNSSMGAGAIKPDMILSILGIVAEFEGTGWRVARVTPQSIAARAGVRNDDVIEAVNDVTLGKDSVFLRSLSVDRLVVRREGQRITLRLAQK